MTEVGDLIAARYRLLGLVGRGSMGVVWRGHDELLRRDVAVKELLLLPGMSDAQADEARRRAMREGRITARLHHPNAITVYDVAEHGGRPCLIMEYLPSTSLSDLLTERTTLSVPQTAQVGRQIAAALAAAHDAGIVHRDLKPGNVLLAEDGTAKLTDFGISHAVGDGTITASGVLAGTPAYLAPEIAKGQDADFRSDVFSFGATIYAALEGQPPFGLTENSIGMLHQIATSEIIPPKNAGALTDIVTWMLQLDPADRPTMRQAQAALAAVGTTEPTDAEPTDTVPTASQPSGARRGRVLVAVVAVVVLAIAGGLIALLADNGPRSNGAVAGHPPLPTTTRHVAPPPVTSSSTPTTTTPTITTPTQQPVTPAPADVTGQLTAAIVDYYRLIPGNLSTAWPLMTAAYQQQHAGGWAGYQQFWQAVSSVTVSGVTAQLPDTVVATIRYDYKTGQVDVERTSFGLVQQNGQWEIASSSVLSHTQSS